MNKYKCSCGQSWFSSETLEDEQKYHSDESKEQSHKVKQVKTLTCSDYVEMWESDLENENRHSLGEMPSLILSVLTEKVKDVKVRRSIMKRLYELGIGLG